MNYILQGGGIPNTWKEDNIPLILKGEQNY